MAFESRSRLHEIRCPTLVMAGSDDNAVPMHHASMLHDGIAGSKLVVIAGAYKQPLEFCHCHLGSNRIGNKTSCVGGMVYFIELFRTGFSVTGT